MVRDIIFLLQKPFISSYAGASLSVQISDPSKKRKQIAHILKTDYTLLENFIDNVIAQLYVTKIPTISHLTKLYVTQSSAIQRHQSHTTKSAKNCLTVQYGTGRQQRLIKTQNNGKEIGVRISSNHSKFLWERSQRKTEKKMDDNSFAKDLLENNYCCINAILILYTIFTILIRYPASHNHLQTVIYRSPIMWIQKKCLCLCVYIARIIVRAYSPAVHTLHSSISCWLTYKIYLSTKQRWTSFRLKAITKIKNEK